MCRKRKIRWERFKAWLYIETLTKRTIKEELFLTFGSRCYYCKRAVARENLTLDHVIPKSKGGQPLCLNNLVLCCLECNQLKGSQDTKTFVHCLQQIAAYREKEIISK